MIELVEITGWTTRRGAGPPGGLDKLDHPAGGWTARGVSTGLDHPEGGWAARGGLDGLDHPEGAEPAGGLDGFG